MLARCGSDGPSSETLARIREAHHRMLTMDAHVEFSARVSQSTGRHTFDPAAMDKGGLDAAVIYAPAFEAITAIRRMIQEKKDRVGLGLAPEDAYRFEKEGRHTVFLGLGSGDAIGADLSSLADFHGQGVRFLKLCGDSDNAICDSPQAGADATDRGLSDWGKQVIAECNRLGLVIDVGGCSTGLIADVLAASRAPVVCSLGAAQGLCDVPGNLADDTIVAITRADGVVLVPFEPRRLVPPNAARRAGIADIAAHVGYLTKLAGADGVGIGSNFGGGGGFPGCEDASEMTGLTFELLRRGVGEHDLEAVWGGNIMRVFKRAAGLAAAR